MGNDVYEVQTAAGEVRVQFGWNRWVTVEVPGRGRKSAAIAKRAALERLLVDCGVSHAEARGAAKGAWKQRPHDAWRPEATAWESPWKEHKYGTLFVFVLGLVAAFVYTVVLKLDWVGV
jgi:hypothetical protein